MKRYFLIITALLSFFVLSYDGYSQQTKASKKILKQRERAAADSLDKSRTAEIINNHDFTYTANEIVSTGHAMISNIRLNSLWYISVRPNNLKCFLPIYGTSSPTSQPTLLRRLDFTTSKYEIDIQEGKYNSKRIKITALDVRSNTSYEFLFDVPENGRNTELRITSTFTGSVTFNGNILD